MTTDDLPLPTLLSRLLIAFTTEFDNEAEHRLEHRTTLDAGGTGRGPWLVSQAMWANFMQFVGGEGVPLHEVDDPHPPVMGHSRAGPGGRPRLSLGLRPYPGGWRARNPYLRQTTAVLDDPDDALPHYPMVLHRGVWPDGS
jgi:hypothetical protein